jgi:ABC-type antimicrobial peptide transport system permease subunit
LDHSSRALILLSARVVLGVPLSLAAARFVRQQLFGLKADDPLTYAGALIVVSTVVILSRWLPARRAEAINPVDALRYE